MKTFFKITAYLVLTAIVLVYLGFLFVLPAKVDLNTYKPQVQQMVKENYGLDVDLGNLKVYTTPILEAGVKSDGLKVSLPDGSTLFSADSFKGKVSLPNLLWRNLNVSLVEVNSPRLNVEIENGEKFKAAKVYEDIINEQRKQKRLGLQKPETTNESQLPIDISKISITVPNIKINDYKAVIDDTKNSHKLTLKGEELKLAYLNGETAKLKTNAEFFSDNDKNITADLNIDTFLPKFKPQEEEEDDEAVFALPFVNPVTEYQRYNLKSNISSKLKIRKDKKDKKIKMNGFLNIDDTTVTMAGLQLPESYFKLNARGFSSSIDTNIYVTEKEYIKLFGDVDYGKSPYVDLTMKSPKVYLNNVLNIAKAYLDTIHIKNDIANMTASGYLLSNAHLKTDFSDINSSGKIIVREGNITDKNIGLLFNDINVNLFFDDNIFKIVNTHTLINNKPLKVSGKIDSNSIANVNVVGDKIPLRGLYSAFAPREIKQKYSLKNGYLSLDAKVTGEIKDIAAILRTNLENLVVADNSGNFVLSNNDLHLGVANYAGEVKGKVKNKNFNLYLPKTNSIIKDDLLVADIEDSVITLNPTVVKVNSNSNINIVGHIEKYLYSPQSIITASGKLNSSDISVLLGQEMKPYLDLRGNIPVKADFTSKNDKMRFIVQALADGSNYITPVKFDDLVGGQTLVNLWVEKNKDTLKINKSGLFARKPNKEFSSNLPSNLSGAKEIVGLRAMASNLSLNPFINIFKISINKQLNGSIYAFKNSRFSLSGQLFAFGQPDYPHINGHFVLKNIMLSDLYTTIRQVVVSLGDKDVNLNVNNINANHSNFNADVRSTWALLPQMILQNVRVSSRFVDVDRLLKVSDAAAKIIPQSSAPKTSQVVNIPVTIQNGSFRFDNIKSGKITVKNTTGRLALFNNILYLNRLNAYPLGGNVSGNVSLNLATTEMKAKVFGKNFNIEKVLLDMLDMKDTLTGRMNFTADVSLKGFTMEEQMKSLKGFTNFNIKNGQLGPFGKFENFLMSENLRENAFFSSAVGSIITNIVTIDTSRFNQLYGHLTFNNGFVNISPIKTQGDIMSMYIAGKANLLDNTADIKVRGKLASSVSDSLGPLAYINPVNLVKNTSGLNIVAAKSFALFCEEISQEELSAIPHLGKGKTDRNATKFQIVLRGDTRKPLKMLKSFKWLALNSEIESAKDFVDTIPEPVEGEESLSVEELIKLREDQAQLKQNESPVVEPVEEETITPTPKVKNKKSKKNKN